MLTREQTELITKVAPGSGMGTLMRRYWLPVLLSSELPEPDSPPVRVRHLGENLVALRDSEGRPGLLGANCPHRGAPLYFARNEEGGLRCIYHGWKFDVGGRCMEMPNVPPQSDFKDRVRHLSYPCVERAGLIWTYLGPPDLQPAFPSFDWTELAPEQMCISKQLLFCNYLQAMEGDFDPSHISFLHSSLQGFRQFQATVSSLGGNAITAPEPNGELTAELEDIYWKLDPRPVIMVLATEYGLFTGARRSAGARHFYYRFNHFIMPVFAGIPRDVNAAAQVNVWVPVDDEHTMVWRITYLTDRSFTEAERREQFSGLDAHVRPDGYLPAAAEPGSQWVPALNRNNDYGFNRAAQRESSYSGLTGVWAQDRACTEGMGPIMDRTQERLASSDIGITQMRRILVRAVRALRREGIAPPGVEASPVVSAIPTALLPREMAWTEVAEHVGHVVQGKVAETARRQPPATAGSR